MKKILFLLIFSLFLLPNFVFASCSDEGVTVVYINGIFTSKADADKDLSRLRALYNGSYSNNVTFITGYNPSHLNGLGDVTKSVMQAYGVSGLDTDLIKILQQVHSELSTRKVLLVGHSQGTFYTNLAYEYLIHHGVSPKSIAVYNIATPADRVAGYGGYLTSATDNVINKVVRDLTIQGNAYRPLPANIYLPVSWQEQQDQFGGHDLSSVYLARAPDRILSEMQREIQWLSLENNDNSGECFTAPNETMVQKTKASLLAIGDKTTSFLADTGQAIKNTAMATTDAIFYTVTDFIYKFAEIASDPNVWIAGISHAQTAKATSSFETIQPQGSVVLSAMFDAKQDDIDDYLEKLDMLKSQLADADIDALPDVKKDNQDNQTTPEEKVSVASYQAKGARTIFPKILISEVQTAGATDSKEEFVELYNPNDFEIDLGNWYLQRKTKGDSSYTTYVPSNVLVGKKIGAYNFLLIARLGYFSDMADVTTDNALTDDNALALKNPNGEISDKLGFGEATDFENLPAQNPAPAQSIGRSQDEKDTENNLVDFLANVPTPRAVNVPQSAPSAPKEPVILKNILINEIQIDSVVGTGGTDDDWVELYNPNDEDVSLAGYSLQKHSKDSPCSLAKSFYHKNFADSAVIKAHGFFLIVSTKASDTLKSLADMTASFALSDDNTIYLVSTKDNVVLGNESTIVDKVGFGTNACFSETAPAPSPEEGKSIERKKLGQDTGDNSQDFKISDEITPGATFPKATIFDATDYANNTSQLPNPPAAPFYNLLLKWQSTGAHIDFYQVQMKTNNGDWQDWQAKTTDIQANFWAPYSLLNNDVYQFRVRAQDKDGVLGDWSKEITVDLRNPLVISEVAFAGTDADANDQWIELYNTSDQDIDLAGYKIISGNGTGQNAKDTIHLSLKGTILAKGYFVLERNDDHVLENVTADQLFFSPIGVNYIYLRAPNNRYIDEFYVPQYGLSEGSFIKNGRRVSMERVSAISFGLADRNWQVNNEFVVNGTDRNDEPVAGTPGAVNSVNGLYTYYNTSFIENTTLKKEFSPYLFAGQNTMVAKGVTLIIEPGTTLKFYDRQSKLEVRGTLNAIGLPDAPIVFTSFLDDKFGGDSNGDVGATIPNPGDWLSLYFSPESQNSQLENIRVRFAGAVLGSQPLGWGNAVWVDGASISLKNSVIEHNRNRALVLVNSNSVVDSVSFLQNNITDWPFEGQSMGIWAQGGMPQIRNSNFESNYYGIFISGWFDEVSRAIVLAKPKIENNTFVKNVYPAMFDVYSEPDFAGNVARENVADVIVLPNEIVGDLALKPDLPYLAKNIVLVRENATLTLKPGVTILFNDNRSGLQINGKLLALGLSDAPISFKPLNFADANIQPGAFLGLRFTKTSSGSELENVSVIYGGSRQDNAYFCGIRVEETAISLKNSVISKNAGCGLGLINSLAVVDGVEFSDNTSSNLTSEARALWVQGNAPVIKNSIFKNNYYGIYQEDFKNEETGEVTGFSPVLENNQFENNIIDIFPLATPTPPTP